MGCLEYFIKSFHEIFGLKVDSFLKKLYLISDSYSILSGVTQRAELYVRREPRLNRPSVPVKQKKTHGFTG